MDWPLTSSLDSFDGVTFQTCQTCQGVVASHESQPCEGGCPFLVALGCCTGLPSQPEEPLVLVALAFVGSASIERQPASQRREVAVVAAR